MTDKDGGPGDLRDWFAGREMTTYRRDYPEGPLGRLWSWLWDGPAVTDEEAARECYEMADAMLRARERHD